VHKTKKEKIFKLNGIQEVGGSIPLVSTIFLRTYEFLTKEFSLCAPYMPLKISTAPFGQDLKRRRFRFLH